MLKIFAIVPIMCILAACEPMVRLSGLFFDPKIDEAVEEIIDETVKVETGMDPDLEHKGATGPQK